MSELPEKEKRPLASEAPGGLMLDSVLETPLRTEGGESVRERIIGPELLTINEQTRLTELEGTIERTKGGFVECGKALAEIRDSRLYRKSHPNFEAYCKDKFGWVRRYANRLIQASKVVRSLENETGQGTIVPYLRNEAQATVLVDVPPERREAVIAEAVKSGAVTAKSLSEAKQKLLAAPRSDITRDETGYAVPQRALPFWNRKAEVKELLAHISAARSAIRKVPENDPMYVETNLNSVLADLNNAYTTLEVSVPYAVCPQCQGQIPAHCRLCRGRGVVSKFRFKTMPEELIAIRQKSCHAPEE